ncbi:hypothetical protein [Spirillospora sp. NBC_01491]|uniref:hypothetical protein n=1 Tax=Spirillospora sp. NBC_01491 TaxID=2976007 RepID=UPI002E30369A|nr:hypothetical protein [Spirillospora sp. NBC_01491]
MSARDADLQRAMDRAAAELARRLDPWAAGMQDPAAFAAAYLEWCAEQGLRLIPRPAPIQHATPGAPPSVEWRRAAAEIRGEDAP